MVKNKALPDTARPCKHPRLVILSLSFFLSLSLADLALSRLVSHLSRRRSSWGYPWILLRLDPGRHNFVAKTKKSGDGGVKEQFLYVIEIKLV